MSLRSVNDQDTLNAKLFPVDQPLKTPEPSVLVLIGTGVAGLVGRAEGCSGSGRWRLTFSGASGKTASAARPSGI